MKKNTLDASYNFDFDLIGIISTVKEYKLAWLINKKLAIRLVKHDDMEIEFLKQKSLVVSNFLYETETSQARLLKNKSMDFSGQANYLLPELHKFDFLFTIHGFEDTFDRREVVGALKEIPQVQFAQILPMDRLKSKENLIF